MHYLKPRAPAFVHFLAVWFWKDIKALYQFPHLPNNLNNEDNREPDGISAFIK